VPYGFDKAKVTLDALQSERPPGRLVLVSAITPTDAGEGKTTTSIGLAQGFARLGQGVYLALREPSLGPTFGQKGGATGCGRARVVPFANIAHGCNSVVATTLALARADWVVTEAGFGFDLGAEKFFDITCVSAGLDTAAVVLVANVRALKLHGGVARTALTQSDPAAVERGLGNLAKHVENIRIFGESPVVALNRFGADTDNEMAVVRKWCEAAGVPFALSDVFAEGGEGGVALAETVAAHAEQRSKPLTLLYDWNEPIPVKMEKVARATYGVQEVTWTKEAQRALAPGGTHEPGGWQRGAGARRAGINHFGARVLLQLVGPVRECCGPCTNKLD